jgi:hypothetical protein
MKWRPLIGYALLVVVVAWAVSSCGYDGRYRYACQDPTNWNSDDCKPPLCIPSGTCTKDLIYES